VELYIAVFLISAGATFLQTSIGFGFAVFSMVFLHRVFPYGEAIALCQAFAAVNTVYVAIRYHKYIQFKIMIPLLIPSVLLGIVFTIYSYSVETQYLKAMLGLVLFFLSIYMVRYSQKIQLKPSTRNGVFMGSLTGIGNGLFGIGGPPAVLYLLPATDNKLAYLATAQAYFSINNITNLSTRFIKGDIDLGNYSYLFAGWAGVAVGVAVGLLAFRHIKAEVLKKCIYAFVGINGVWIIVQELIL
jgi:hypothetical protein